jgi:GNAT superfamily N-acetyltransferase
MKLLPPDKYALAAPALRDVAFHNLFTWSVIERHVSGAVYVDHPESPKIFYIIHPYGMSLLYGDISEEFIYNTLKDYLLNKHEVRSKKEWLQIYPVQCEAQIDAALADKMIVADKDVGQKSPTENTGDIKVIKHTRINFKFNCDKFANFKTSLTENYQIVKTDDRLFRAIEGAVVPNKFWDSEEDFAKRAAGFTLVKGHEWITTAFSSFIHENLMDLGMETKPEYRKQGYAPYVCARLIDYCLANGYEPLWACSSGNLGSYYLAQKLGFEPVRYLPYYELKV